MAAIPRGIRVIDWRNADRSKSTRYRIRIERQDFQCDRSFEDLELAILFLEDTKSHEGRVAIKRGEDRATIKASAITQALEAQLTEERVTLGSAISLYIKAYLDPKIEKGSDKVQRSAKINRDRLLKCKSI